jgi:hypothetical protein
MSLNRATNATRSVTSRSTSFATPLAAFASSSAEEKCSPSMSITVLPNIWINRR